MQCGCPECGTWMSQVQKGLKSHCACAACGYTCNACMGTGAPPIERKTFTPQEDEDTIDFEEM